MKKIAILLAVAMITANSVGCAHRLRDWFYQGSYCGSTAAPMVSAPVVMPQEYAAPSCCPTCPTEPSCGAPGQTTYGPVYDGGAMMAPSSPTYVTPSPE